MPYYKDIYYADGSTNLSVADISYAEAVSTGDKLESIKYGAPIPVQDDAQRLFFFPNPKQGDAVWRYDYGFEQRYFEEYSASNLSGRTPAGWYAVGSTLKQLPPITTTGSTGTVVNDGSGFVTFSSSTNVFLNNVFTTAFTKYRAVINCQTISPGQGVILNFCTSGVANASALYAWSYFGTSNGNSAGASGSTTTATAINIQTFEGALGEETIIDFYFNQSDMKLYPSFFSKSGASKPTVNYALSGYFNSSTTLFDGLKLTGASGTASLTGSMRVYGYN